MKSQGHSSYDFQSPASEGKENVHNKPTLEKSHIDGSP